MLFGYFVITWPAALGGAGVGAGVDSDFAQGCKECVSVNEKSFASDSRRKGETHFAYGGCATLEEGVRTLLGATAQMMPTRIPMSTQTTRPMMIMSL